ncbi:MAG: family 43 glycosylhydrolase [Chitinispirillaceae bacterium]|nr:family 43 glycosylhydrolase [Chitinispirillaceae bacterium]
MVTSRFTLIAVAVLSILIANTVTTGQIIQNDVFWKDTDGNPMYVQRGGTLKIGDTWYMYGSIYGSATTYYNTWTGSNARTPSGSASCYTSKDLVNWKFEGAVFRYGGWFCGPNVAYNQNTKKYVLIAQANNSVVFATADKPTGPFTQHHVETPSPMANNGTGDATTFIDEDETPYIICSSMSGRSHMYVIPLRKSDYLACERTVEIFSGAGREGNCMFKYKGRYYAASGDLHGWNTSHCYYISSDNILGPYNREAIMINSGLDYAHVTQSGFFITVNGTEDTTVIYCGDRWCNNTGNGIGYNQWCPITVEGTTCTFNSLSNWSIDAVKGTWKIGPRNNYILNPCFEADRITVGSVIGWEGKDPNAKGSHSAGEFCLSLGSGATATQKIPQSSSIAAIPSGTYELKAWVKGNGQIAIADFGGTEMKKSSNASNWTEVSISGIKITTGKATVSASNAGGGTCTMDEFSLMCTDPVPVIKAPPQAHRRAVYDPATYSIKNYSPGTTFQLELFTVDGKKVLKHNQVSGSGSQEFRLPVHQLGNGNYLMKMVYGENVYYENVNVIR